MKSKIFVQLASYRDPQLVPTIEDMLAKARNPEMFTFGICWQYDDEEDHTIYDNNPNFRINKFHYTESKGLGWARNNTNSLYRGEEFTLQLDSHHRFAKDWDVMLLQDYYQALTMSGKPVISTYCTPFDPYSDAPLNPVPSIMSQYEFSPDRLLMSMPFYVQDYEKHVKVIRNRTISGHFYFVKGNFIHEVPYDPEIYFGGYTEETTLSLRAFTHGYDVYCPYRGYIWHEYTRNYRKKHWDDHGLKTEDRNYITKTSGERDTISRNRTRQLFGQEHHGYDFGIYGLGSKRTLRDYEIFGGFDFTKCRIHEHTLHGKEAPNPLPWENGFPTPEHRVKCSWDINILMKDSEKGMIDFIALGVEGTNGTLDRVDFLPNQHPNVFNFTLSTYAFKFKSQDKPIKWVLYPHYKNGQWGTRQEGEVKV
jgi:glycosyltransferase involved in cell wall biosynthesis